MDEAIQDLCRVLHQLLLRLRQHLILQALRVKDEVQGVVIVGHLEWREGCHVQGAEEVGRLAQDGRGGGAEAGGKELGVEGQFGGAWCRRAGRWVLKHSAANGLDLHVECAWPRALSRAVSSHRQPTHPLSKA